MFVSRKGSGLLATPKQHGKSQMGRGLWLFPGKVLARLLPLINTTGARWGEAYGFYRKGSGLLATP